MSLKNCPPCTGECNQGRSCPHAFDEEQERQSEHGGGILKTLLRAALPWIGFALIVLVVLKAVKS